MAEIDFLTEFIPENIAPAIRGCIKKYEFPVVTFAEIKVPDDLAEEKTGFKGVDLEAKNLNAIYAEISKVRNEIENCDFVYVHDMGTFVIAASKSEVEQKTKCLTENKKFAVQNTDEFSNKRLKGRIAVITGGAQGFGLGIAEYLADNGAQIVIADINEKNAKAAADKLNAKMQNKNAIALQCDVSDEESVKNMCRAVTRQYGGIDIMHSNAGISEPGSLETMTLECFERITRINYTAFFLICKYASRPMKVQSIFDENHFADIIQTNSKAGLKGWLNNFAYCGSKFGSIGLVQSISRDLVKYRIKVNCVCPGNYYTGPLWGDPEKGLFVKYFKAGKVPGAKGPEDVRDWYFSQEIFGRGCYPSDVAKAVMYAVEQKYETGQAIPVAGGLEMLS